MTMNCILSVSDLEISSIRPYHHSWCHSCDNAILRLGITWHVKEFRKYLGPLTDELYPLDEWLCLYGKFVRRCDYRDLYDTQQDALV